MSVAVLVFGLCAACCAIAQVAIVLSVVRTRATAPADAGVPRPRLATEIAWAVLPALVLALLLTATWTRVRGSPTPTPDVMMKVAR